MLKKALGQGAFPLSRFIAEDERHREFAIRARRVPQISFENPIQLRKIAEERNQPRLLHQVGRCVEPEPTSLAFVLFAPGLELFSTSSRYTSTLQTSKCASRRLKWAYVPPL